MPAPAPSDNGNERGELSSAGDVPARDLLVPGDLERPSELEVVATWSASFDVAFAVTRSGENAPPLTDGR